MKITNRVEDDGSIVDVAVVAHDSPQDSVSSSIGDKNDSQKVAMQSPKKKRRKRSDVWNHFTELEDFDAFESEDFLTNAQKTQLELYLDEVRIDRNAQPDLDVLGFWKAHKCHYPELSKMALDILAIPITTVASESAFSIGGAST
ncbi:hypothetical protein ACH5RR_003647 [Cinchona calisaya]|uniref:HAT C-terminal dimerisation domain-containing protein n=1 Tax=Cinchona calisaya TaxID=153742 RepID=A0ABD3AVI2_9GENT